MADERMQGPLCGYTYAAIFGDGTGEPFGDLTVRLPPGPRAPDLGLPAKFIACMFFAISSSTEGSFTAESKPFSNRPSLYPTFTVLYIPGLALDPCKVFSNFFVSSNFLGTFCLLYKWIQIVSTMDRLL